MGGSNFDLIAQEVLEQKRLMEQLEDENRVLRRQIADLRAGRGIFVEIEDRRFALVEELRHISQQAAEGASMEVDAQRAQQEFGEPFEPISEVTEQLQLNSSEASPPMIRPSEDEEGTVEAAPTFLEEVMIDEFAAAATTPLAVWSGFRSTQESLDEEEKAALRRQLSGSFLLE